MNFSNWLMTHKRSILFLLLSTALFGMMTAFFLPVTLFPAVNFPRIMVSLDAGDRPAEQMVMQVTSPVEEAIRRVPGVQNIRSDTGRGSASISINFDWGTDMLASSLQVNAAIAQILAKLPKETAFSVRRMDPSVFPIMAYSLTSDKLSSTALHKIAQHQLRPLLISTTGIAKVDVSGGAQPEYQININPQLLASYGLTIDDIAQTLSASNVLTAIGKIEDHYKLFLVIADSRLKDISDIGNILINSNHHLVYLKDVATITQGLVPQWVRINADGKDAVLLEIFEQPNGNSVQIAKDVKHKLATYQSLLPPDVKLANWYDQSELVATSADSVRNAIILGILLAAGIIWLFLRNVKIMLISMLVVPAALSATMLLLYAFNMSFNIMTLGGMAAAVGLIVDDAIVMLEHLMRRIRSNAEEYHGKIIKASLEFFRPLAGSSMATIIIFLPLAFLSGVTGTFFKALSITMSCALLLSFLLTWLAVPLLVDHFLTKKDATQEPEGKIALFLHRFYESTMQRLFKKPVLLLLGVVPLLLVGILAYYQVGSEFMPSMDEGGFNIDYKAPPSTSLSETDRLVKQAEAIISSNPDVQNYSRRTGIHFGGADSFSEANEGDFLVRLKSYPRHAVDEVMDNIRQEIETKIPGLDVEFAQLMEDMIGDLTAVPQPIEIKIYSDDAEQLEKSAQSVAEMITEIKGVVDVRNGINPTGDALTVQINQQKAALEGMTTDSISATLNGYLTGKIATQLQTDIEPIGVRVWIPKSLKTTQEDLAKLVLRSPEGHLLSVDQLAKITEVSGQSQISRENLKRMLAVTARISGRDMGSVMKDIQKKLSQAKLMPTDGYYQLGGLYQQQQIAFKGLIIVFLTAFGLVFLLQLFLYENFLMTIAAMIQPLLAVAAVFLGLWLTGTDLNISSMMGMTMIVGIITEVSIFYFTEYQKLVPNISQTEALITAGKNRMRPIIMTTLAAILALLPLALSLSGHSTMEQPLAIAIISGLLIQIPLVMIVMPVLIYIGSNCKRRTQSKQAT